MNSYEAMSPKNILKLTCHKAPLMPNRDATKQTELYSTVPNDWRMCSLRSGLVGRQHRDSTTGEAIITMMICFQSQTNYFQVNYKYNRFMAQRALLLKTNFNCIWRKKIKFYNNLMLNTIKFLTFQILDM